MDRDNIYEIAAELCRLFQQQMDALGQDRHADLHEPGMKAYKRRQEPIRELLADLHKFRRPS
jgi:hypothetical protein